MNEEDFKQKLNPEQYRVMRQKDTERPFSGKYWDSDENGIYTCAACGNKLFLSLSKFDSETGWPSFKSPCTDDDIFVGDERDGKREVGCRNCGSHLGYVVPNEKGKFYYQINSAALNFIPIEIEMEEEDEEGKEKKKPEEVTVKAPQTFSIQNLLVLIAAALIGAAATGVYASNVCLVNEVPAVLLVEAGQAISSSPVPVITTKPKLPPRSSPVVVSTTSAATSSPASGGSGSAATSSSASVDKGTI